MKKSFLWITIGLSLILSACGSTGISQTDNNVELQETQNEIADPEYIDGFEKAEYEKFNSYASENGLGDSLVFVEGTIINKTVLDNITEITLEQDDKNRWTVGVFVNSNEDSKAIDSILNKKVRVFGVYTGYSDAFNLPAIALAHENARIEMVNSNGDFEIVWSFLNYVESNLKNEPVSNNQNLNVPTMGETNALNSAIDYLKISSFSYQGLIDQLEYEKYSHEEAVYAADNCGADWNEQAVKTAEDYLKLSSFSKDALVEQLEYEGFTHEQAVYGVEQNGY